MSADAQKNLSSSFMKHQRDTGQSHFLWEQRKHFTEISYPASSGIFL